MFSQDPRIELDSPVQVLRSRAAHLSLGIASLLAVGLLWIGWAFSVGAGPNIWSFLAYLFILGRLVVRLITVRGKRSRFSAIQTCYIELTDSSVILPFGVKDTRPVPIARADLGRCLVSDSEHHWFGATDHELLIEQQTPDGVVAHRIEDIWFAAGEEQVARAARRINAWAGRAADEHTGSEEPGGGVVALP